MSVTDERIDLSRRNGKATDSFSRKRIENTQEFHAYMHLTFPYYLEPQAIVLFLELFVGRSKSLVMNILIIAAKTRSIN
jgi:hypothetical protein